MDAEIIYSKLDQIDTKLGNHVKEMENRVSTLEADYKSIAGRIKVILSVVLAGAGSAIGAAIRWLFN